MNLNHVTIYSDKPLPTVEFFEKLGLIRIVDSLPRYARLQCPDGDSTLSVHVSESGVNAENIVLYFECENLEAEILRLKSLGIELDGDLADRPWLWREAYIKDPNGNSVCLFHAGINRINPPWRIA